MCLFEWPLPHIFSPVPSMAVHGGGAAYVRMVFAVAWMPQGANALSEADELTTETLTHSAQVTKFDTQPCR